MLLRETFSAHWRVDRIDHENRLVYLTNDQWPVEKKFGLPESIVDASVEGSHLVVTCANSAVWQIRISDGSRRKLGQHRAT